MKKIKGAKTINHNYNRLWYKNKNYVVWIKNNAYNTKKFDVLVYSIANHALIIHDKDIKLDRAMQCALIVFTDKFGSDYLDPVYRTI